MSETRRLPTPAAHRELTVLTDGEPVARSNHLLSASINTVIDRIATAKLVYQDGSAAKGDFPLAASKVFTPGVEVEVKAGSGDDIDTLFKGIVISYAIKVRANSAPQLVVECKHAASKMTVTKNRAYFSDSSDSDVIESLFNNAGVAIDIENTDIVHETIVQYEASDWDFCLLRARANNKHLITDNDSLCLKKLVAGDPIIELNFGSTILDADLEIDARFHFNAVQSQFWDKTNQEISVTDADNGNLTTSGNVSNADLADALKLDNTVLHHPELNHEEAQVWANSHWAQSQLNLITGRIKCEGIGSVKLADTVTLSGLGDRFNGETIVTGIRHQFDLVQGWKTHFQFGGIQSADELASKMSKPASSSLLPAISGLHIGIVTDLEDPENEFRAKVMLPLINDSEQGCWARVASLDAGDQRGSFFRPEQGDEVIVGFLNDDPRQAVILGMVHSSAKPAPLSPANDNHEKIIQTRSKMKWLINDDSIEMSFETPAGNLLSLSEDQQAIQLKDQNGNSIIMNQDGITIDSSKALNIKAAQDLSIEAGTAISIKAGSSLMLEGGTSSELKSTGNTTVKGTLVNIN